MSTPKVRVSLVYPPIPIRAFDYCAVYEDDEPDDDGNIDAGYGKTAEEAERDLLDNFPRGSLLPCPFCGGAAARLDIEQEGPNFGGSCIECVQCGACGPGSFRPQRKSRKQLERPRDHRQGVRLMTPFALKAWRKRLDLSQSAAAKALGLSLRGYQNYENGTRPIKRYIALACAAVARGIKELRE